MDPEGRDGGKSREPIKDWTSSINRRKLEHKWGVEATRKHYEKEQVAYYIYSKFGQHLLTFNSTTRHEVIPLYGEHIRRTNEKEFDASKNLLQNRKASSQRAHKKGLQRELSTKNLPVPDALSNIGNVSNSQVA